MNQSKRAVRRHFEKHPAPGPVLWDSEGRAVRAFQAPSTSYVLVLDRSGRVVYTGIGTDQKIEEAVARVLGK
ncbi:MAG: hypothetical protein HY705_10900 [Gemmatimonadetes bacterium]|nr:hypothetical protein [Gemmatimonadota bacterium]